ncbi:hypothetical protein GGR52DRAFT_587517 [Hypoxylon sp. FL1284]|nr:hypothetical protein GGR52DRAFT_587517 [Hypoxylon sp. FL1284]
MQGRGSLEDAKALAAEFTRAKTPRTKGRRLTPSPSRNEVRGRNTGSYRGRPVDTRPSRVYPPYDANTAFASSRLAPPPLGTTTHQQNSLRPVRPQQPDSNPFLATRDPRPPNLPSAPAPPMVQPSPVPVVKPSPVPIAQPSPVRGDLMSFNGPTSSSQAAVRLQTLGSLQRGDVNIPRPVSSTSNSSLLETQDGQGIDQPVMAYTARSESRPTADDGDVVMADSDASSGYRRFGARGLQGSRWNMQQANDGNVTLRPNPVSVPAPAPERRAARPPTGLTVYSGMLKGPGLKDSRWAD